MARRFWTTDWRRMAGSSTELRGFHAAGVEYTVRVSGGYGHGSGPSTYKWAILDHEGRILDRHRGFGHSSKAAAKADAARNARRFA